MSAATPFPTPLRDAETELRRLFMNAPFGVAQCGRQGTVVPVNPALEQMIGDRIARCFTASDLIDPQSQSASRKLFRELFDGERESFELLLRSEEPKGTAVRWSTWRVAGADGKPDSALSIAQESAQTEPALHHSDDDRLAIMGRLTGGVAHDFNNLLTGVLLYCDLLLAGLESGDRAHTYATQIRRATIQASGLVAQLLRVLRPSDGEQSRPLLLNDVIEEMRTLLVRLIGENIELKLRLDPNLGLVKSDPTEMRQILLNLVLNARDAMPQGGEVTLETRNGNVQVLTENESRSGEPPLIPCALFVVSDNGRGMDLAARTHLFEPFFTTKPAGKGNGIGLNTVRNIVRSSGGLIHVDSARNSGTRVTILLPLVPDATLTNLTPNDLPSQPNEGELPPIEKD
jgi:two-component system cell cycle sensor histidine kinase/response regulator CckA